MYHVLHTVQQLMSQHFPIAIERVADKTACWLVQDGYVTLYSPKWKIPLFTAEKLEGDILRQVMILIDRQKLSGNAHFWPILST